MFRSKHLNLKSTLQIMLLIASLGSILVTTSAATPALTKKEIAEFSELSDSAATASIVSNFNKTEFPTDPMAQVTSVSQLSDIRPTSWAFQALQSLVERYGCIPGYANNTYHGDLVITRYEFASGLNACISRIHELIATKTANLVTKEDLETLKQLQRYDLGRGYPYHF